MAKTGGGLLMYRRKEGVPEVLLAHPGGPYFQNKNEGFWSVPKGIADKGEAGAQLLDVAKREFTEETGLKSEGEFIHLGTMRHPGKTVEVWAFEGDCDPSKTTSNTCFIEWPPRSGKRLEIPEVDRTDFFTLEEARHKLEHYQAFAIDALEKYLATL